MNSISHTLTHLTLTLSHTHAPTYTHTLSLSLHTLTHLTLTLSHTHAPTYTHSLSLSLSATEGITPDGIPKLVIVSTALPLTVIYYILAIVGIIFAVVCLFFNIIFRKRK